MLPVETPLHYRFAWMHQQTPEHMASYEQIHACYERTCIHARGNIMKKLGEAEPPLKPLAVLSLQIGIQPHRKYLQTWSLRLASLMQSDLHSPKNR